MEAFHFCSKLRIIEIPIDSQLQIIEKGAFNHTFIESFAFPSHFKQIDVSAFGFCDNLKIIEINYGFEMDSNKYAFKTLTNSILMIPVKCDGSSKIKKHIYFNKKK